MARDNRFFQRQDAAETQDINKDELLLKILQQEFPDDYLFKRGQLQHDAKKETGDLIAAPPINKVARSEDGIVRMSAAREEYVEISAVKAIPTVDDDELDEILDEEYEFFIDPDTPPREVPITGEFYVTPLSPLNPVDFHDLYLRRGPAVIGLRDQPISQVIEETFCVYFIQNNIARPIPNYKTLEVMLVERSLTYGDIKQASAEDVLKFDMNLDGNFAGDITADEKDDPVEEFRFRQMDDRSALWSERIRFESGYRPGGDFKRDPGDYIKPSLQTGFNKDNRAAGGSIYIEENPEDFYYERVFQGQTYKEKLREKFEGKMIIAEWPNGEDFETDITSNFSVARFDDLSRNLRMMTLGYWKQVTDLDTIVIYSYINNIDISGKRNLEPEDRSLEVDQFISERGALNQLINAGGVTVIQELVEESENIPAWNDFPHIAEVDALDRDEYQNYIDNYLNPFELEHIKPYEPPGSIKYYNQTRVLQLQQEAQTQARVDEIKEALRELILNIGPRIAELTQTLAIGGDLSIDYVEEELGLGADIYNILDASSNYTFVKRRNNGNIKNKYESKNFIKVAAKNRIYNTMGDNKKDLVEDMSDALGTKFYLNNRGNDRRYDPEQIPNGITTAGVLEAGFPFTKDDLTNRTSEVVGKLGEASRTLDRLNDLLIDIDEILVDSTNQAEIDNVYTSITELLDDLSNVDSILSEVSQIKIDMEVLKRKYVNECYSLVQKVRRSVYNDNSKYGIKWSEDARDIINAYVPGKEFSNYLPDGVE